MNRKIWCALAVAALGVQCAFAQSYPTRPIRWVVPYPAGGPTDFTARTVGAKLSEYMGQQVVIDNRPGAGTVIATELVVHAAPDGYTILFGTGGGTFLAPLILPKVPYDPHKDLAPVAMLVQSPQVLVVHPSVAAKSVSELVALAKAKPGALNFASVGHGTSPHLGGELFQSLTGTKIVHVPYKGTAPAMTDLIAGQVQIMFTSMPTVLGHVKSGKLRLLGSGGTRRSAVIPDAPLIAETVPGFELITWYGVFAPAKMPPAIIRRLNEEINKSLKEPEVRDRLAAQGLEPTLMSADELKRYTTQDAGRWAKLIKAAGIKQ